MTRVTENMMYGAMNLSIATAKERLLTAETRAASAVSVEKPSDNPEAATRATAMESAQTRLDAMGAVSQSAATALNAADGALNSMAAAVNRASDIAIDAANGDLNPSDRIDLEAEIAALRASLLAGSNTQFNGDYIFSGNRTDVAAFAANGTFQGDPGVRQVEVSPGVFVSANISGADVLAPAGGVDVLGMLQSLATDLQNNDQAAISARLGDFTKALDQITSARSVVGAQLNTIATADTDRAALSERFAAAHSDLVEVDTAKSYTDLVQAQQAYQATISQASTLLQSLGLATRM